MMAERTVDRRNPLPPDAFAARILDTACSRLAPALVTVEPGLPRFETFFAGRAADLPDKPIVLGPVAPQLLEICNDARRPRVDFWLDGDSFSFEGLEISDAPAPWSRAVLVRAPAFILTRLARSARVDAARTPDPVLSSYDLAGGEERYCDRVVNLAIGGMLIETSQPLRAGERLEEIELSAGDDVFFRGIGEVRHAHSVVTADGTTTYRSGVRFGQAMERARGAVVDRLDGPNAITKLLQSAADLATPVLVVGQDGKQRTTRIDGQVVPALGALLAADESCPPGPVSVSVDLFGLLYSFDALIATEGSGRARLRVPEKILRHRRRRDRRIEVPGGGAMRVRFNHPVTGEQIERDVLNVSGRGFAIRTDDRRDVFLPGMRLRRIRSRYQGKEVILGDGLVRTADPSGRRIAVELDAPTAKYDLIVTRAVLSSHPNLALYGAGDFDELLALYRDGGLEPPDLRPLCATSTPEYRDGWNRLHAGEDAPYLTYVYRDKARLAGAITLARLYDRGWGSFQVCATGVSAKLIPGDLQRVVCETALARSDASYLLWNARKGASSVDTHTTAYMAREPAPALQLTSEVVLLGPPEAASRATPPGIEIDSPQGDELDIIEGAIRRTTPPLLVAAAGLDRVSMALPETARAYQRRGLVRRRDWLVARRRGEIVAAGFVERGSTGMHHLYTFNAIRVFPVCEASDLGGEIRACLLTALLAWQVPGDAPRRVGMALASDDLVPYQKAGFQSPIPGRWFVFHRVGLARFTQYVERRFGQVAAHLDRSRRRRSLTAVA